MAFPPEKPKRDTRTIPINRRTLFLAFVILMVGLVVGLIIGLILTGSSSDTTLDPTRTAIAQINRTTVAEATAYSATFAAETQAAIVAEVTAAAQANVLLPPTDTPSAAISAQSAGCTWNPVIDTARAPNCTGHDCGKRTSTLSPWWSKHPAVWAMLSIRGRMPSICRCKFRMWWMRNHWATNWRARW